MHLSPAEYVIHVFGGVRKTARAVGRTPSTISKWQKNGRKGFIPPELQPVILRKASELNLDLCAMDLITGREIDLE